MPRQRQRDPFISYIILGVALVVVVVSYVVGNIRRKKRTEALQRVADQFGLSFSAQGNQQQIIELGWSELFSRGHSKKVLNLMRGSNQGREVAIFDYHYVTGHGKSAKSWRSTVACPRFDGPPLPGFSLRPEGTWDKISGWFGGADIDFDTHPKFSRAFLLRGQDEPAIRLIFTPNVLNYYEQRTGVSTEGSDLTLLFYRHGKRVPPDGVSQFLADAFEALSLFRGNTNVAARA